MKKVPKKLSAADYAPDLRAYRNPSELHGTCYFELMPSRYRDRCWNQRSLFIPDDAFLLIEWAFARHITGYDHYSFMYCDTQTMQRIAENLAEYALMIRREVTPSAIIAFCGLPHATVEAEILRAIHSQRDEFALMIDNVQQWIAEMAGQTPEFSILGM